MSKVAVSKAGNLGEDTRRAQFMRGAKNGLIKGTVDKIVNQLVDPIADKFQPMLNNLHPGMQMAEGVTKAVLRVGILMALAEVLEFSGPALAKVPGVGMDKDTASAKTKALAMWIRNYAAENLGMNVMESAAQFIPMFVDLFKTMDLKEILNAVENQGEVVQQTQTQLEPATANAPQA